MLQRYSNLHTFHKLAVLVLCLTLIQTTLCIYEFDVYRLVAFEQNGQALGSKVNTFSLVGTHFSGDLLRKLALIRFSEVNTENINTVLGKKLSGLLIILPQGQLETDEAAVWRVVSDNLVNKNTQIPVYFCEENDSIMQFYEKSKASITHEKPTRHINHDIDSNMNFIVTSPEPKISKSLAMDDFYGVLDENTPLNKISGASNPVILVVASYDSFSYVPDAKVGLNAFSSGAIALLNVAKQLSEFYEGNKETNYNVLFYLTSSRSFNYEGIEIWLNKAENNRITSRIEYGILLHSLGSTNNLNLHLYNSDQVTNGTLYDTLRSLEQISKVYDTPIQLIQTNTHLLTKKFPVLKISDSLSESTNTPTEWVNALSFDADALKKNIALVTEFMMNSVYGINKTFQVLDSNHLNQGYFTASLNLFESKSTFPPQIVKDSAFTQELYRAFSEVVKHPYRTTYTYSNPQFYTSGKGKAKLTRINSAFFDLYLLIGNIAWLSVLFFIISQTNKTEEVKRPKEENSKRSKNQ